MLAELVDQPAHSRILKRQELVFEPKYDGMRALIELNTTPSTGTASPPSHERADAQEAVRIYSRRGNNKTLQFPELVEPLERLRRRLKRPVLLDGEIVAVDEDGVPLDFSTCKAGCTCAGSAHHVPPAQPLLPSSRSTCCERETKTSARVRLPSDGKNSARCSGVLDQIVCA